MVATIFGKVKEVEKETLHEKRQLKVLESFLDLFPVRNACLFRYSCLGYLGEGIIRLENNEITYIHHERYDVRTLPAVHAAIREKKAKIYDRREIFEKTASQYVLEPEINSYLISPIFCGGHVFGYIHSNRIVEERFTEEILEEITLFCKEVGGLLFSTIHSVSNCLLSRRELEVMEKVADGQTTKEIADLLGISELTVKQYIKLALKKLNAKNRAHAVSELFRRGILS